MSARRPALVLGAALCAACGGESAGRPAAEVLDSAGVRVVLNGPPRPEADPTWTVSAEPVLDVGVVEGAPEYQLFRVEGATVLSDGTLVVANGGTGELRFFDRGGRHLYSAGGQGDGPGEFQRLQLVGRFGGDSLLALDGRQRRVSVFDRDGTFARSFRPGEGSDRGLLSLAGVLADGDVVIREPASFRAGEVETGAYRLTVGISIADAEGVVTARVGEFTETERFVLVDATSVSAWSPAFARGLFVSAVGDRVAIGNNDGFSIRVYDATGSLVHVVRQRREIASANAEDLARWEEEQLAEAANDELLELRRAALQQMPRHETFPAYASLELDHAGNIWVEEYRRPGDDAPVWQVFDREGVFLARVRTPVGLDIEEIGEDFVLGVARDDFDVEHVRLYRLERGAR